MRVMPRFGPRIPGDVAARLGVRPGERVVAWARTSGTEADTSTYLVATGRALYVEALEERIRWDRVSRATWDEPDLVLTVLDEAGATRPTIRIRIDEPNDLPPAVFDRVTDSVVVSERVDLSGTSGAVMVARRGSDDDVIRWSVVFDAGLNPADPRLRVAADAALARLRDSLGI